MFDWSPETWTAIGTLGLAFGTFWLGYTTRRLATESTEEVRADWRPVIVSQPIADGTEARPAVSREGESFSLVLRNVGRGPALELRAQNPDEVMLRPSRPVDAAVAPGDYLTIVWDVFRPDPDPDQDPDGPWPRRWIVVDYHDVSGVWYTSRFDVALSAYDEQAHLVYQFVEPAAMPPRKRHWTEPVRRPVRRAYWKLRSRGDRT